MGLTYSLWKEFFIWCITSKTSQSQYQKLLWQKVASGSGVRWGAATEAVGSQGSPVQAGFVTTVWASLPRKSGVYKVYLLASVNAVTGACLSSELVIQLLPYSKESRMNGQYQQPLDSLNNDNKYVRLQDLGAGGVGISQTADLSFPPSSLPSEQSPSWWQPHSRDLWCEGLPKSSA